MQAFIDKILSEINHFSMIEIVAVILGVVQVILAYRNKRWNFIAGLVCSAIFIYLFLEVGLYAESGLQIYYLIMSVYGWWRWSPVTGSDKGALQISFSTTYDISVASGIIVLGGGLIYYILSAYTDSSVPMWDAAVSALAWAGTWLMTKRRVANWLVLNMSNAIAIPLLFYKEMYFTSLFTLFLFVIAVIAYIKWYRIARNNKVHHKSNRHE